MFRYPLSKNEIIRVTRSAEKICKGQNKDYKYKNEFLINFLEMEQSKTSANQNNSNFRNIANILRSCKNK